MMVEQERIAVLIACHNRVKLTLRTLSALKHSAEGINYDVYLVDDGSTDGTGEAVRDRFPRVHVIQGDGKLYWAKGMRHAWEVASRKADYDFYLWLNDDLDIKSDALRGMLSDYEKTKGVVVGACSQDNGETICSYGASDEKDHKIIPCGIPQIARGWLNGNFVLVPREVYQKVGMISGEYTHARADYDYAERLKRAGVPFYCSSDYIGSCRNDFAEKMRGVSLWQRIKLLRQPGYFNLRDLWLIRSRYHGFVRAVCSCAHLIALVILGK